MEMAQARLKMCVAELKDLMGKLDEAKTKEEKLKLLQLVKAKDGCAVSFHSLFSPLSSPPLSSWLTHAPAAHRWIAFLRHFLCPLRAIS